MAAWNLGDKFSRDDFWVVVKYRGTRPGAASTLVKVNGAKAGRFYGDCSIDDKRITIEPKDVVDWWYRDEKGKTVGKFVEQVASGKK